MKTGFRTAIVLATATVLAACGGDDGPNVALMEVSSPEAITYSPGQPFSVDFKVDTDRIEANHVGVNFFVIEQSKAFQLEIDEEADEYDVGIFYIEELIDGEQTYTADLLLPNDISDSGEFIVVAYIDAAGVIQNEPSDRDNLSQNVTANNDPTWGTMTIDADQHHDFIMSKVEIGDGFLLLPQPDDHDDAETGAPITERADLIGFFDAIKHGSDIATATVTGEIEFGGQSYPVHFWHEFDNTYTDNYDIEFPNHEEEHYFPFDIALNGELVHALADVHDIDAEVNSFELTLTIVDTSATVEDDSTNNSQTIEVPFFFFEETDDGVASSKSLPVAPSERSSILDLIQQTINDLQAALANTYTVGSSYGHTYGDKGKVAIALSFGSHLTFLNDEASAEAKSQGSFDLYMFDDSVSLIDATLEGNVQMAALDGFYDLDFSLLGISLITASDSVYEYSREWSREWSEEQELFRTTFTIAIVPVTVRAGVSGSLGISAGIEADAGVVTATGTPVSISFDAFAEAGIDLGVASGGVRLDFLIFLEELSAEAYADMSTFILTGDIDLGIDITNELKAIEGEFSLFVRYTGYKFCCKFPKKEATKTIYNTGALYDKTWTLYSQETTVNPF